MSGDPSLNPSELRIAASEITDVDLQRLQTVSRFSAVITAGGAILIGGAIAFSVWQLASLQGTAKKLEADIKAKTEQYNDANVRATAANIKAEQAEASVLPILRASDLLKQSQPQLSDVTVALNQALQADPKSAVVFSLLSEVSMRENKLPQAISLIRQASEIKPQSLDYRVRLASLLCTEGGSEYREQVANIFNKGDFKVQLSATSLQPLYLRELSACANVASLSEFSVPASEVRTQFAIRRLYLQIREPKDRTPALFVADALCKQGYRVEGIEQVSEPRPYDGRGSIRYYYEIQAEEAGKIKVAIENATRSNGLYPRWADMPTPRQLQGFKDLPKDLAEVWLPPVPGDAVTAAAPQISLPCKPTVDRPL